jgi:hypothetical protein
MNVGFPHRAVACGRPRKCVLQSPEYRRRGRMDCYKGRFQIGCQACNASSRPSPPSDRADKKLSRKD